MGRRHRKNGQRPREEAAQKPTEKAEVEALKPELPKPKDVAAVKKPAVKQEAAKKEAAKPAKKPAPKRTLVGVLGVLFAVAAVAVAAMILMLGGGGSDEKPSQPPPVADNGDGVTQPPSEPVPVEPQPPVKRPVPRTKPGDQPDAPDVIRVARGEEKSYRLAAGKWYSIELPEGSSWTIDRWRDVSYRFPDGEVIEAPFGKSVEMPNDWNFQFKAAAEARIVIRVF